MPLLQASRMRAPCAFQNKATPDIRGSQEDTHIGTRRCCRHVRSNVATATCRMIAFPSVLATPVIPCRARLRGLVAEGSRRGLVALARQVRQTPGHEFDRKILRLLRVNTLERCLKCCGMVTPDDPLFLHDLCPEPTPARVSYHAPPQAHYCDAAWTIAQPLENHAHAADCGPRMARE